MAPTEKVLPKYQRRMFTDGTLVTWNTIGMTHLDHEKLWEAQTLEEFKRVVAERYLNNWVTYEGPNTKMQANTAEIKITPPAGTKYDTDKVPLDLLDPQALEGLAKVLQFGANKYAAHNWRGGIAYSRLTAAMLRHMFKILEGEYIDPESGLPHIDHAGCCWMFLSNMMKTRPDLNDLFYKEPTHTIKSQLKSTLKAQTNLDISKEN